MGPPDIQPSAAGPAVALGSFSSCEQHSKEKLQNVHRSSMKHLGRRRLRFTLMAWMLNPPILVTFAGQMLERHASTSKEAFNLLRQSPSKTYSYSR